MMVAETKWMPEMEHCECGQRAWLVRRNEGFLNVWRVMCTCGHRSLAYFDEHGAVENWNARHKEYDLEPVA